MPTSRQPLRTSSRGRTSGRRRSATRRSSSRRARRRPLGVGREPVQRPQPLPRLRVPPRLHGEQLQPPAVELRRHRARPRRRPGDRQRPGRRADRRPADVRGPRQRQPDHAASTASPASPTSTCSSRSPARSTRPCVDGDLDTSVFGHEYTHAISNRMVGGPDDSLTGLQAGAMGESWSDLVALEYLHAHGYVRRTARTRGPRGAYVTGNNEDRHPRLRARRQPAQLLRHRLRHLPARRCTPTARSGTASTTTSGRRW